MSKVEKYSLESALAYIKKQGVDYQPSTKVATVKNTVGIHTKGVLDYLAGVHKVSVVYL
jgi:hypothetical protein